MRSKVFSTATAAAVAATMTLALGACRQVAPFASSDAAGQRSDGGFPSTEAGGGGRDAARDGVSISDGSGAFDASAAEASIIGDGAARDASASDGPPPTDAAAPTDAPQAVLDAQPVTCASSTKFTALLDRDAFALFLDSSGFPHVIYTDSTAVHHFAQGAGSPTLMRQTAPPLPTDSLKIAAVVDASDVLHALGGRRDPVYARRALVSTGPWTTTNLGSGGTTIDGLVLAVSGNTVYGAASVFHSTPTQHSLIHRFRTSSGNYGPCASPRNIGNTRWADLHLAARGIYLVESASLGANSQYLAAVNRGDFCNGPSAKLFTDASSGGARVPIFPGPSNSLAQIVTVSGNALAVRDEDLASPPYNAPFNTLNATAGAQPGTVAVGVESRGNLIIVYRSGLGSVYQRVELTAAGPTAPVNIVPSNDSNTRIRVQVLGRRLHFAYSDNGALYYRCFDL